MNTLAKASARFQSSSKGKEQQLTATVKLPIPSAIPAATTSDAASTLILSATLFRSGVAYAVCSLPFDKIKTKSGNATAEYKLEVKRADGRLRSKEGACDTNLSATGEQRGVPAVQKGDTIVLEEVAAGVFMDGSF